MSDTNTPYHEYPNTYFVQDRTHRTELTRIQIQDQMLTAGMGGVWPEQCNPERFQRVLDVGCGTGAWLIEIARTYASASLLVGVDTSKRALDYARMQAEAAQVSDRVEFHIMDALRMLEFPAGSFDLVNQRFAISWLRTWDWPRLLRECQRVTRPGGVIRITEPFSHPESTGQAHMRVGKLLQQAFYSAGHLFKPEFSGLTDELAPLLRRCGIEQVQTRVYTLEYRCGTPQWQSFFEDSTHLFPTLTPFLRKWLRLPGDYEELYKQALTEMQQPDYLATWHVLTAWGITPLEQE